MTATEPERAVVDGIALRTWPATDLVDAPVAVVWPAMGVPGRFYRAFAGQLATAGLTTVVADLRGTGESGPPPSRSSRYGYLELADDVGTVLAEVRG